jgi:hypothetical protein
MVIREIDAYINSFYNHARIVARTAFHGSRKLSEMLS